MAKTTHPLELAFTRFDDTTKRYFKQVQNSFGSIESIPDVQQPKKRTKNSIYTSRIETPFGRK